MELLLTPPPPCSPGQVCRRGQAAAEASASETAAWRRRAEPAGTFLEGTEEEEEQLHQGHPEENHRSWFWFWSGQYLSLPQGAERLQQLVLQQVLQAGPRLLHLEEHQPLEPSGMLIVPQD